MLKRATIEIETAADFGAGLQHIRERRGITVEQVAELLHINSPYIKAIEAGEFAQLPPPVYARGYIRSYSEWLGLNAEVMLQRYDVLREAAWRRRNHVEQPAEHSTMPQLALVISLLALVLASMFVQRYFQPDAAVEPTVLLIAEPVPINGALPHCADPLAPTARLQAACLLRTEIHNPLYIAANYELNQ